MQDSNLLTFHILQITFILFFNALSENQKKPLTPVVPTANALVLLIK